MSILDIHPEKIKFLNGEAARIALLLQRLDEPVRDNKRHELQGSASHMDAIDLTGKSIGPSIVTTVDSISKKHTVALKECEGRECIGYDDEAYKQFKKLITAANKEVAVNSLISEGMLEKASFRWAIDFYKKLNVPDFITFLSEFVEDNVSTYKIYFPLSNLHIIAPFKIGDVEFEFFTKEYFDRMTHAILAANPSHADPKLFSHTEKKYKGHVFAAYTIRAGKDKAIQVAFEHCALAVDVLKACSRTTMVADEIVGFDIDSRIKFAPTSEVIVTRPHDITDFRVNMDVNQYPYNIDHAEWGMMQRLELKLFSDFLLDVAKSKSELKSLIINSLARYGNALSGRDLHQRVVELYTILESLLLNDENSPILETVTKYLSMIVEKDREKRLKCAKLIRSMYKVRSSLIHHGKKVQFEIEDLTALQVYVVSLLLNLITLSKTHSHKRTILNEIDDAMLSAY